MSGGKISPARAAIGKALDAGATGDYVRLAYDCGVAPAQARWVLSRLVRANLAAVVGQQAAQAGPGRPRAVFASAPGGAEVVDGLRLMREVWR